MRGALALLTSVSVFGTLAWLVRQERLDRALVRAAYDRDPSAVAALLKQGANPNAEVRPGGDRAYSLPDRFNGPQDEAFAPTPLMVASWNGDLAVMRVLLARGAGVNARAADGWTALMGAAWTGEREAAEALVLAGADVNAETGRGETPLQEATDKPALAALLRRAGAKF